MSKYQDISDLLEDDSFIRWIKGDSDPVEAKKWRVWVKSSKKNHDVAQEAQFIIKSLEEMEPDAPDPSEYLKRFEEAIAHSEQPRQLWNFSEYNRKSIPFYVAVAASILIMVVAGIVFYSRPDSNNKLSNHELASVRDFKTGYGQKTSLTLSDGSIIILNANSEMTFSNKTESKNEVDVWLKGEAFFEIKHLTGRAKRMFVVHTKDGTITDIGTRFSVNTRSDSTSVALVEGAVNVRINSDRLSSKKSTGYLMHPGDLALFAKGGHQVRIRKVNPAVYTSWISNKLVFDHTPIAMAARRIEANYGVKVIINDSRLLKRNISGLVRNNNLNALIEGLSKILRVPVRQVKNKVIIG